MPRRRWVFTENGKPLPHPVEIPLEQRPQIPASLPAYLPIPSAPISPAENQPGGNWVDFEIPERKR